MTEEEIAAQKAADEKAAADKVQADKIAAEKAQADKDKDEPKIFTQAEASKWLQDRLADEKRKLDKKAADDKKAAEETSLKEKGEYKILADQKQSLLDEVTPKAQLADDLTAIFNTQIDAEIKEWHPDVKALDPGADNIKNRMEWLPKGRKQQEAYALLNKTYDTDMGKGGGSGANKKEVAQQTRQGLAASGRY